MKSKILIFIIGLFVGVIIATAVFLLYGKLNNKQGRNFNGERPQMMQRNGVDGENQAIPPEKPSEDSEILPEMPEGENQNTMSSES